MAYARKRLDQLTQQLAGYQADEQNRLENSLKVQREEDTKLTELKLKQEAERMTAVFDVNMRKKVRKLAALCRILVLLRLCISVLLNRPYFR